MMVKLNMTKRLRRITVPAGYKERSHDCQLFLRPDDHLDMPLIVLSIFIHASTVRQILAKSAPIISASNHNETTSRKPKQTLQHDAPGSQQTTLHYASKLTTDTTLLDVEGTRYQNQCSWPNKSGYRQTTILLNGIRNTISRG